MPLQHVTQTNLKYINKQISKQFNPEQTQTHFLNIETYRWLIRTTQLRQSIASLTIQDHQRKFNASSHKNVTQSNQSIWIEVLSKSGDGTREWDHWSNHITHIIRRKSKRGVSHTQRKKKRPSTSVWQKQIQRPGIRDSSNLTSTVDRCAYMADTTR